MYSELESRVETLEEVVKALMLTIVGILTGELIPGTFNEDGTLKQQNRS